MVRRIVAAVFIAAAIIGFIAWRAGASVEAPHFVVLVDRSQSRLALCAGVESAAERILGGRAPRRRSSLTLLGTGDSSRAPEPRLIWSGDLPVDTRVFEGRTRRADQLRRFVEHVGEECGAVSSTTSSPIFLGVKRAIEQLRALGCGPESGCALYVTSDGEENVESHLRRAIANPSRPTIVPQPVANDGVRVVFCGLAETGSGGGGRGRGGVAAVPGPDRADRVRQVWTASFSDPELVMFEPFCQAPART